MISTVGGVSTVENEELGIVFVAAISSYTSEDRESPARHACVVSATRFMPLFYAKVNLTTFHPS